MLYSALAKSVLECETVTVETVLDPWDSLAVVSTIAVIDDIYGKSVAGKALMDCVVAGDILKLVEAE
jgi:acyl carrier protein